VYNINFVDTNNSRYQAVPMHPCTAINSPSQIHC